MTRSKVINKLSNELCYILNCQEQIDIVKKYITMAMVIEQEKLKGRINIYQKIDKKTGLVIKEYWGMDEIHEEFKGKYNTVRRLVAGAIAGEKRSAYGYYWKRI